MQKIIWKEVDRPTVLGKEMARYSWWWRARYRYYEAPYGTGDGRRYRRRTRGWYKPIEYIKSRWQKIFQHTGRRKD